jgi:acyl dehydratase
VSEASLDNAMSTLTDRIDVSGEATEWFEITQDRVNNFADTTMDQQWIHVDPERAAGGPFGGPIAHGQLTMSIMSFLPGGEGVGIPEVEGMRMGINLGWNKVRFVSPVAVGSRIRTIGKLKSVEQKGEMLELINEMTVEIEGQDKPACVAESVLRIAF